MAGSGQLPNTDSIPIVNDQMTNEILDLSCKETDTPPRYLNTDYREKYPPMLKKGKKVTDLTNKDDNPEKGTLREF